MRILQSPLRLYTLIQNMLLKAKYEIHMFKIQRMSVFDQELSKICI